MLFSGATSEATPVTAEPNHIKTVNARLFKRPNHDKTKQKIGIRVTCWQTERVDLIQLWVLNQVAACCYRSPDQVSHPHESLFHLRVSTWLTPNPRLFLFYAYKCGTCSRMLQEPSADDCCTNKRYIILKIFGRFPLNLQKVHQRRF